MANVQITVSVPEASAAVASALTKFALAALANHKAGGGIITEVTADILEAVKDLGPALSSMSAVGSELSSEALGVAEAFALAGFDIAKQIKGETVASS